MKIIQRNMVFKVFLDANILLDFLLKRKDYQDAVKVIRLVLDNRIRAFVTPSIIHIVGYWVSKAYGNKKAKELILGLLADVIVIDSNHEITLAALHSQIDDIEDALQYFTAIQHKLDLFLSRDKTLQNVGIASLPVYNMTEFLKLF